MQTKTQRDKELAFVGLIHRATTLPDPILRHMFDDRLQMVADFAWPQWSVAVDILVPGKPIVCHCCRQPVQNRFGKTIRLDNKHIRLKRNRAMDLHWRLFVFQADEINTRPDDVVGYITRAISHTAGVPVESILRSN